MVDSIARRKNLTICTGISIFLKVFITKSYFFVLDTTVFSQEVFWYFNCTPLKQKDVTVLKR